MRMCLSITIQVFSMAGQCPCSQYSCSNKHWQKYWQKVRERQLGQPIYRNSQTCLASVEHEQVSKEHGQLHPASPAQYQMTDSMHASLKLIAWTERSLESSSAASKVISAGRRLSATKRPVIPWLLPFTLNLRDGRKAGLCRSVIFSYIQTTAWIIERNRFGWYYYVLIKSKLERLHRH